MARFTPKELSEIRDYLLKFGKKDSELEYLSTLDDNTLVAVLQQNKNYKTKLTDILSYISNDIAVHGVIDPDNPEDELVLSHNDFTDEYKDKIDGSEGGAQENKIEHVTITKEGITSELPIDDKTVNVSFDDYVPKTYTWSGTSASNKLLNEQEINNRINEAEATFLGQCGPYDTTSATDWVTFCGDLDTYISGGGDKNDYIFCTEVYTEDRLPDEDSRYIYHRWKYANPGATTNIQWSVYKGWVYEYDVIPYYLVTDEYPQANSRNAVESQGIFAFTGDVHKDNNNNYIPLQTQIDEIVAGGATTNLTVSPTVALADGTNKNFTFTASASKPATVVFNGGSPVSFTGSTTFTITINSATPIKNTYNAVFTINGVNVGTKSASAQLAWKVSYGYGTGDYTTAVLTEVSQVKTSPAGEYTITIGADASHIFFKVQSSMSITRVETVGGVSYAVAMDSPVTSDGWKYYRSTSTFDAGTYKFKVI